MHDGITMPDQKTRKKERGPDKKKDEDSKPLKDLKNDEGGKERGEKEKKKTSRCQKLSYKKKNRTHAPTRIRNGRESTTRVSLEKSADILDIRRTMLAFHFSMIVSLLVCSFLDPPLLPCLYL